MEPGLGCCTKLEVKLQIRKSFKEQVDKELDRLLQNGTIEPMDQANWAAPIDVMKNGSLRECADYSAGLNSALKDLNYPLTNIE